MCSLHPTLMRGAGILDPRLVWLQHTFGAIPQTLIWHQKHSDIKSRRCSSQWISYLDAMNFLYSSDDLSADFVSFDEIVCCRREFGFVFIRISWLSSSMLLEVASADLVGHDFLPFIRTGFIVIPLRGWSVGSYNFRPITYQLSYQLL